MYKSALFNSETLQIPSVGRAQLLPLPPSQAHVKGPEVVILILFTNMPGSLAAGTEQQILFLFFPSLGKNAITFPHTFAENSALFSLNCNLCCPVF